MFQGLGPDCPTARRSRRASGRQLSNHPDLPRDPFKRTVLAVISLLRDRGLEGPIDEAMVVARGGCPVTLAKRRDDVIAKAEEAYLSAA